jgi:manganese-transporting P-type ATPase
MSIRKFVEFEDVPINSSSLVIVIPERGKAEIATLDKEDRSFRFQNLRFVLTKGDSKTEYKPQPALDNLPVSTYLQSKGHQSEKSFAKAARMFGLNELNIPTPQFFDLFKEQVVAPFFVFQIFTVGLWCMDEYWQFSVLTLFMLVLFEAIVTKRRIANLSVLRDMRSEAYDVYVYRCKRWKTVSSHSLVPGDVISIVHDDDDEDRECPCDVVLIRGSCIVNEALLTGESVPLVKEALLDDDSSEKDLLNKASILFAGTKILQHESTKRKSRVPTPPDGGALGFVIRTSWYTTQGDLMRTILYSTERITANSGEAFLFIACLLVFAVIASAYVYTEGLKDERRDHWKLVLHCIMILTSVVPPELPMELSLAVNNSLIALRKVQIFCTYFVWLLCLFIYHTQQQQQQQQRQHRY